VLSGESSVVLKPKIIQTLSSILRFCNENNLAVCPQGGNTGLVGGSVPVFDEVVISMERMNKIISVDEISGYFTIRNVLTVVIFYLLQEYWCAKLDVSWRI
jgi:FAD/FMN-containing dehydrogenase